MSNTPLMLRALEDMLKQVNNDIPTELDSVATDAAMGVSQSAAALSALDRMANALELLALAPANVPAVTPDDLRPVDTPTSVYSVDAIDFATLAPTPAFRAGRMFYDGESRAIAYYSETSGVKFDLCKEQIVTVINNSGSTLNDGELVYINGASTGWPTVTRAKADTSAASQSIIGMVTAPMTNGSIGEVCTAGVVHNLDTSAYAPGTVLYLSASSAGGFTSTPPLQPNYVVEVATVVDQHATLGKVYVRVDKKAWFPSVEIRDTSASVVLPTTPIIFKPPTTAYAEGFTYDSSTGVITILQSGSYAISITFNAEPSASNKNVYFYAEEDSGAGWVIGRYTARALHLPNAAQTQVVIAAARYWAVGTKLRFYVWGDATVTLKSADLPGTTPGTVTLAAYRCLIA